MPGAIHPLAQRLDELDRRRDELETAIRRLYHECNAIHDELGRYCGNVGVGVVVVDDFRSDWRDYRRSLGELVGSIISERRH